MARRDRTSNAAGEDTARRLVTAGFTLFGLRGYDGTSTRDLATAAGTNLSIAWRRGIGEGTNNAVHITAPPIAAAGKIFTMDAEAGVEAHDARTGDTIWHVNLRPNDNRHDREAFGGGLAFADGKVYVTSGYRFVAAVDAASGKLLWRTRTDEPIHAAPTGATRR